MEKLIARIIDIEDAAHALTRDAKADAADYGKELKQRIEELRLELQTQAEERLAQVREAEEAAGLARMEAQDKQYEQARAGLLAQRECFAGQWADEIFAALINTEA